MDSLLAEDHDILGDIGAGNRSNAENSSGEYSYTAEGDDQNPEPEVRGKRFLAFFDRLFNRLDLFVEKAIPRELNPFTQSGAIANTTFIVALISGFILLIWYEPSVYQAYDSLQNIDPVGEFFRALHRYSSDACMLFILFHAFKMFFAQRFGGARWLAWVTGAVALAMLWFDGWLGYWLVWDERANQVAVGTARMLDQLPIFAEPLSRSFLTDESFNSLLFFLVFFIHMLIPLAMGIALWLHVSRLNKAHFITGKKMTAAVLFSLTALSIMLPADLTKPARMLEIQQSMPVDYFYMLPVYFTDRLEGGLLWALTLAGSIAFFSVPWLLVKNKVQKPSVNPLHCNGCEQCYNDCPFNAITMLPREENNHKKGDYYASIDPASCMACGICVGSCDPVGIEFPKLPAMEIRKQVDRWLDEYLEEEEQVHVAYICSNSAGADLHIDEDTGRCRELPGFIVRSIPCVGWVHPLMIERALRKGAEGVLVVGCQSDPNYRLGAMWTHLRLEGDRHPSLREDKVNPDRIHYLQYDRTEFGDFLQKVRSFRDSSITVKQPKTGGHAKNGKVKQWVFGTTLVLILSSLTYFFSKAPYKVPMRDESELVVSFRLPGRPLTADPGDHSEANEDLLPHMRGADTPVRRERSEVRLRLVVDNNTVIEKQYEPNGLFNDGISSAIEYIPMTSGTHHVEIYIGDTAGDEWLYTDEKDIRLEEHKRHVLTFDRGDLFKWYPHNEP